MAVFQLPTGVTQRSAGFAYRGGSFFDKRDFAMTAVLVKHPRGDLLIDTGFGRNVDAHFRAMPLMFRASDQLRKNRCPAPTQLDAKGHDRKRLIGIVLTHAHWDHVSGIPDFPDTPVWVTAEERAFIAGRRAHGGDAKLRRRALRGSTTFEGRAYLGFPKQPRRLRGRLVVIVPAPGHTPGSVIVFLALPSGKRYALVGDLAGSEKASPSGKRGRGCSGALPIRTRTACVTICCT